jgi:ribosomal protein S19
LSGGILLLCEENNPHGTEVKTKNWTNTSRICPSFVQTICIYNGEKIRSTFKVNHEVSAMELSVIFSTFVFLRVNIDLFISSVWESKAGSMNFPTRVTCIKEMTVDIGTEIDRQYCCNYLSVIDTNTITHR